MYTSIGLLYKFIKKVLLNTSIKHHFVIFMTEYLLDNVNLSTVSVYSCKQHKLYFYCYFYTKLSIDTPKYALHVPEKT